MKCVKIYIVLVEKRSQSLEKGKGLNRQDSLQGSKKKKKKKVQVDNKLPHFTLKRQVMPRKTKGDGTKGSGIQRRDHCTKSHKQTPAQSKRGALIAPSSSMPRLFFIYLTQAPMKCEGMNHVPLFHLHTAREKKKKTNIPYQR